MTPKEEIVPPPTQPAALVAPGNRGDAKPSLRPDIPELAAPTLVTEPPNVNSAASPGTNEGPRICYPSVAPLIEPVLPPKAEVPPTGEGGRLSDYSDVLLPGSVPSAPASIEIDQEPTGEK